MRILALALLVAIPAFAQETPSDPKDARIAELEAAAARDAETIADLRKRIEEADQIRRNFETLRARGLNQTLENRALQNDLTACRSDLVQTRAQTDRAGRDVADAERRVRQAEDRLRRAESLARNAQADARRAESEARRARSQSRRCN